MSIRCLVALLVLGPGLVMGDDESTNALIDTSRWICSLCPYNYGWTGHLDFGAGWVSDDSLKFGDYRGLEDEGAFPALDGELHRRSENDGFVDVYARDLGISSRQLRAQGGQRGRYQWSLGYQEIPKFRGFGAQTPFLGVGGNELSLPANWKKAPETSGFTNLEESLQHVSLEVTRKTVDIGLRWKPRPDWTYEVSVEHQKKEGTRPFGGGVFTLATSHLPASVDFSTGRLDTAVNYSGSRTRLRIGFAASEFDNRVDSITWPHPFETFEGTEILRASLEPDNSFYQASISASTALTPSLKLSGHAAWGRMTQNDRLLPWSSNPDFEDLPLPRQTADARVDVGTLKLSGKLSARMSNRLDFTARLHRDERDNETPIDTWVPVVTDFIQREARPNRPYSFERDRASASLRYRPSSAVRLNAGLEREDFKRSLQSVLETEERSYFAEAKLSPGSLVEVRARLESSDRNAGPFNEVDTLNLVEHPLMRKFHLADRERERLQLDLDFYPLPDLTLSLGFSHSEDDFDQSPLGLQFSDARTFGVDLSWVASERFRLFAWASKDELDSHLKGAESDTAPPWNTFTEDTFLTTGFGLVFDLNEQLTFGLDFVNSESEGNIHTIDAENAEAFPDLQTDLRNIQARFEYRARERWAWRVDVEHENYDSRDWAIDGLEPDAIPSVLTFGADSPDYSVTVVRIQGVYRF